MRAFDAKEVFLNDKASRDMPEWSPVSLLQLLSELLGAPPPVDPEVAGQRRANIYEVIEVLEGRGMPFDPLLRDSVSVPVGMSIGSLVSLRALGLMDELEEPSGDWSAISQRWATAMEVGESEGDEIEFESAVEWVARAVTWAMTTPLDELIDWWPASGAIPARTPDVIANISTIDRWVVDRFLGTYVEDWAPDSLLAEWEWIHGTRDCPVPDVEMRARKVDPDRLARQIADNAVSDRSTPSSSATRDQHERFAKGLLEEGRREAAVGVFEVALYMDPNDASAHNNRGFCLLPDDPGNALVSLDRAAELHYEPRGVNVANRAVALFRLGRYTAAHEVADQFYSSTIDTAPTGAYLWDVESLVSAPTGVVVENINNYLAEIGIAVARAASDDQLEMLWESRIQSG